MCIGSNWVNEAQDLKFVTKFEDLPNSLIPNTHLPYLFYGTSMTSSTVPNYVSPVVGLATVATV